MKKNVSVILLLILIGIALWILVFKQPNFGTELSGLQETKGTPPLPVAMMQVKPEITELWQTYPAKVEAINFAKVRPQVSGEITQVKFKAGSKVVKGQVLMVIDTNTLADQLNVAKADLAVAESSMESAVNNYERAERLVASNAISQKEFDQSKTEYNRAQSAIELAKSRISQAQTNLNYAYIRAPFTGVISRAEITEGNVVQAGPSAPVLFSILSSDGVYIDFDVDEQTYLSHINSDLNDVQMKVIIPSIQSVIDSTFLNYDNASNGSSGTIRARGVIKGDTALLPGMSVRASISTGAMDSAIIIPETAIGVDQNRRFVWVVDENNVVQYRPVQLGASVRNGKIVQSGLNEGEVIVIDGLIKIRPNTVVMDISKMQPPADAQIAQ